MHHLCGPFFSCLNFQRVKFLKLLYILQIFQIYYTSNFIFLQNLSFKTVIAHIALPGSNQSAGTVYKLDEIELCNPQGGDSYWKCEIWQVCYFKQWPLRKRPEQAEDHSYEAILENIEGRTKKKYCLVTNLLASTGVLFDKIFCLLIFHFLLIPRFLFLFNSLPILRK